MNSHVASARGEIVIQASAWRLLFTIYRGGITSEESYEIYLFSD